MKARFVFVTSALTLAASAAQAQYYPASYQEPYCREFTKVVDVGGRPQSAYGTACMQPDGSWQIVSDDIPATQPVQYIPAQHQVTYVPQPVATSSFSFSFGSWNNPNRTRYYNDYGHGWRDKGHGNGHRGHDRWDGNRGHGRDDRGRGNGRGHDRH